MEENAYSSLVQLAELSYLNIPSQNNIEAVYPNDKKLLNITYKQRPLQDYDPEE